MNKIVDSIESFGEKIVDGVKHVVEEVVEKVEEVIHGKKDSVSSVTGTVTADPVVPPATDSVPPGTV